MKRTRYKVFDAEGTLVAIHERLDRDDGTKDFKWRQPDGTIGLGGFPQHELPLYGSHLLAGWPLDEPIVVTEGEKAARSLSGLGVHAVATVCGASMVPADEALAVLAGRHVVLWPDNDEIGRKHMEAIADRLGGVAASVRIATWADAPAKGDAADLVAVSDDATAAVHDVLDTAEARSVLPPARPRGPIERPYPEPPKDARYGLAGDFLAAVEPHTEADPAALLLMFLAGAGAMLGSGIAAEAGDAAHPPRLNVLVVGDTGKGRKGTGLAPVRKMLLAADAGFAERIASGLSSGEGLIYHVRDAVEKLKDGKDGAEPEIVTIDAGVDDKRLLVTESEFASVLRVMQRDGNSLSPVVRLAWDGGTLSTLTRNNPLRATGAHVAIVGQITRDELIRYLDRSELANGFINRFLLVASKRSRILPDGGSVPTTEIGPIARRLREAIEWARTPRLIKRDPTAAKMWSGIYEDLSSGRPGMLGAATNRAEAQVLRLSVVYAALDQSTEISGEHLLAALDAWRICDQSAYWVFGDATGNPVADTILEAIRARGELSRTDVRDLFHRHTSRSAVERAIVSLSNSGRIVVVNETTGGRPKEVLRAA